MLKKMFLLTVVISSLANAKSLSPQEMRERLQVQADIYVLDSDGKKVIAGPARTNFWRSNPETGEVKGDWSSNLKGNWLTEESIGGLVALRHKWEIDDKGVLKVSIEEFSKDEPTFSGSVEKKEYTLNNFEPIVWRIKSVKNVNFVVRYVPSLREVSKPISLDNLPVAGTGISISDNNGYLWAEDVQFNGKYSGVTSHRGTLALSYVPFSGAKEMGFAEGNLITINVDKKFQINLKSSTSFLPAGVTAKIYAIYNPNKKSKGFNSLHTFDTSKEDRLKESLQR